MPKIQFVQPDRASKRSSRKDGHRDDRGRRPPEKERDERGRESDRRRKEREVNETESRASPTDKVRHALNIAFFFLSDNIIFIFFSLPRKGHPKVLPLTKACLALQGLIPTDKRLSRHLHLFGNDGSHNSGNYQQL
jgi:hypothetical protein